MQRSSPILSLLAAGVLFGCAEGMSDPTNLEGNPGFTTHDAAVNAASASDASSADAGSPTDSTDSTQMHLDAGHPATDAGATDAGVVQPPKDAGSPLDAGDKPDAGPPPMLSGLILYEDGVSDKFALYAPHTSPDTAQTSNSDSAYLMVNDSYSGPNALFGKSIEVQFITKDNTGNFGVPLMFWLGQVGYKDGVSQDITSKKSIHFSIRTETGSGVLNVLAMAAKATSTSREVSVGPQWKDVALSTTSMSDWVVYDAGSFANFALLQLNFLGGAAPPNGFKGGAKIYIDNVYID